MAYRNNNYTVTFDNPLNTTHKMTSQGMAQGFQMSNGNPWGMLIGAIAGTITGGIVGRLQTKEAWKTFQSQLKAADAQNKSTLQELGRNLSEVSRQRAVLAMETQSALMYNKTQAVKANAEARNTLAAADQVGSAVAYAKSQVDLEASQQDWMARFNYETQQWNLNAQAQNLINTADAQFVGVNVNRKKFDVSEALQDAISAGASIAQTYASKGVGGSSSGSRSSGKLSISTGDMTSKMTSQSWAKGMEYMGKDGFMIKNPDGTVDFFRNYSKKSSALGL